MLAQRSHSPAYGDGIVAALFAEAAFLLMMTAAALLMGMDAWQPSRMAGALVLGPAAMVPAGFDAGDVLTGLGMHAGMAVLVGLLYALLLPRLRLSPIAGGILTGMLLYLFGFWVLPLLFPEWLAPFWVPTSGKILQAVTHTFYGVVFGWVYARRVQRRQAVHEFGKAES